jgi:hypothetical protein
MTLRHPKENNGASIGEQWSVYWVLKAHLYPKLLTNESLRRLLGPGHSVLSPLIMGDNIKLGVTGGNPCPAFTGPRYPTPIPAPLRRFYSSSTAGLNPY